MKGIYKITNTINNKVYIGQSIDINSRLNQHKKNKYHNEHLCNAINKYGIESFKFEIVEQYEEIDKDLLDEKEVKYIHLFNCLNPLYGYNKKDGGSTGKQTEEVNAKKSKSMKDAYIKNPSLIELRKNQMLERYSNIEEIEKHSKIMKKVCNTKEWKERASEINKKRYEDPIERAKTSEANKKRYENKVERIRASEINKKRYEDPIERAKMGKKIICIETDILYETISEASRITGIGLTDISKVCLKKRITAGGFHWKFASKTMNNAEIEQEEPEEE